MNEPPPPAEPASIEKMAAMAFTPWETHDGEWTPPSNDEWAVLANPHLVSIRLAWLTVHKTRDELIAMAGLLGDDGVEELVGQIGRSADWFKGMHDLLCAAECRMMCALAAVSARDEKGF